MASVTMHQEQANSHHAMTDAAPDGHAQGHAHAGHTAGESPAGLAATHAAHAEHPTPVEECGSECCGEPGSCQCLCLHHAQAVVPLKLAIRAVAPPGRLATAAWDGHPSPPPSEDIRPPIG